MQPLQQKFSGIICTPLEKDLPALKIILETWIRNEKTGELFSQEIEDILMAIMNAVAEIHDTRYLVAEENGEVLGIMGFRPLTDPKLKAFTTTTNPAELVNAYVTKESRAGRGVGTTLLQKLEELARTQGFTEIVLNSGPRYRDTAWGFYTKMYGEPIGTLLNYYGSGLDAPVWHKVLR